MCHAWSLTRVTSDHTPICLDSGEAGIQRCKYFTFERQWLLVDNFKDLVCQRWLEKKAKRPVNCYSLENALAV